MVGTQEVFTLGKVRTFTITVTPYIVFNLTHGDYFGRVKVVLM